jgi:hypothetical protein
LSFANTITDLPAIKYIDGDGDLDIVSYDPFNLTYYMFKDVRAEKGWSTDSFEFQNMDYCFGWFTIGLMYYLLVYGASYCFRGVFFCLE